MKLAAVLAGGIDLHHMMWRICSEWMIGPLEARFCWADQPGFPHLRDPIN
jgi:hypothetical protein